jgi:hypothetical protein
MAENALLLTPAICERSRQPARRKKPSPAVAAALDFRANLSNIGYSDNIVRNPYTDRRGDSMRRERNIRRILLWIIDSLEKLQQRAKERGLKFKIEQWRGRGGHAMVWVGYD